MAALSAYLADALINHSNGVAAYTMPTVYVALTTTASTAAGIGTEAAYTGYARVALSGLMGSASAESAANIGAITFGACTARSSTIVGFALMDAATGAMAGLDRFLSAADDRGTVFQQDFSHACVPVERGRISGPIESYVATGGVA